MTSTLRHTAFGVLCVRRFPASATAHSLLARLHPDEAALARAWGERRQRTFAMGRLAAHEALATLGHDSDAPILPDERGAPRVAAPLCVSVSHKDEVAAALALRAGDDRIGVDVEPLAARAQVRDISSHVLTEAERAELAPLDDDTRRRELLLRFSLKEALYKALDPFVRRYVGFLEVEARPQGDGPERDVTLTLPASEGAAFRAEARLILIDELAVSLVRVARAHSDPQS